jgi:hypothetical protein
LVGKATTDTLTNKTLTGAVMNGTLGATTPSTASVTTLTTSSTITHNGGTINGVAYLDGSKVLTTGSALTFDGSGAFKSSGTTNGFLSSGTFVNSSNGASAVNRVQIGNDASDGSGQIVVYGSQHSTLSNVMDINNAQNAALRFLTNNTEGLRLTSTSLYTASTINVGIGTSSPAYKLDVLGSTGSSVVASFRSGETTTTQRAGAGFQTIGSATAASRSARMWLDADGGDFAGSDYFYIDKVGSSGEVAFIQQSNAAMTFHTNATKQMTLDASGNLLVGTTDANPNSGNGVKSNPGTSARTSIVGSADTNANFALTVYSTSPSAYRFQVGYGGTIYATSTSITAISDASLKTNVRDLETGLTEVMALQPRRFDWINGDASNVAGFIAQEVKQVLPDLVEDYQYSDEETKLGLKMGDILPTLVKAIQEQQALITQLTARITALEGA